MRLLVPAALLVLVLASGAAAFDRYHAESGDTYMADALSPGATDEYVYDVARGTIVSISAAGIAPGTWRPSIGIFGDDYLNLTSQLAFLGRGGARNVKLKSTRSMPTSGRMRVLAQAGNLSIGAYRLRVTLKPSKKFVMVGTADQANPPTSLLFGAYPGYEATVQIRWKGTGPVTLTSFTGPDGEVLTSQAAPKAKGRSFTQSGYVITALGDHGAAVDVPAGTTTWSVTVRLKGQLAKGGTQDVRVVGTPQPDTIRFGRVAGAPAVAIVGERGGPNELALTATRLNFQSGARGVPTGFAFDPTEHGSAAGFSSQLELGDLPTSYQIRAGSGLLADVVAVQYDQNLDVASYEVPLVRTPRGSGSARLFGFTYDAAGDTTGWIEERTYHATGNTHTLAISGIERFPNRAMKAYHVVHTAPGGTQRGYDFVAFDVR